MSARVQSVKQGVKNLKSSDMNEYESLFTTSYKNLSRFFLTPKLWSSMTTDCYHKLFYDKVITMEK